MYTSCVIKSWVLILKVQPWCQQYVAFTIIFIFAFSVKGCLTTRVSLFLCFPACSDSLLDRKCSFNLFLWNSRAPKRTLWYSTKTHCAKFHLRVLFRPTHVFPSELLHVLPHELVRSFWKSGSQEATGQLNGHILTCARSAAGSVIVLKS